jgi:hypothetical protein
VRIENPRVIEQNVETPERLHRFFDCPTAVARHTHIRMQEDGPGSDLFDSLYYRRAALTIPASDRDLRALFREQQCSRLADARTAACDQSNPIVKSHIESKLTSLPLVNADLCYPRKSVARI